MRGREREKEKDEVKRESGEMGKRIGKGKRKEEGKW